ncbi:(2Fe-2S)-binding protein [Pusillimonas minor]|uniref:(2Fe-2S)-binding protein n=1 Tax=Pusillimonas minor TaxID=2697024 RepID=A0A842HR84_9BURK|nr:(2Fe-2S)-binding protein [Pusillimonas minor]MBC2769870.1 (2Fe-2S)-binding protein [Pusillimonas minor]
MVNFNLNGAPVSADVADDTPLLWVLREQFELTGTKFGCGMAQCGACTVHIDGEPTRSCVMPVAAVKGKNITTIEGFMQTDAGKALEKAWVDEQVAQCGYCQSGQIMSAAGVLKKAKGPLSREEVLTEMSGNLCRCGTYNQVAAAVINAQKALS